MEIFQFMTFHIKLQQVQNHGALGLIKQMELLGFVVVNLGIQYYLIMDCLIKLIEKSGITESINHNFGKIRIDSYNSLPIEKILVFHNVIILIMSVVSKDKNSYYHNIFLEKGLYKDKSDTRYF